VKIRPEGVNPWICRTCGEHHAWDAGICSVCLEPRTEWRRIGALPWHRGLWWLLLSLLFMSSCTALLPVGMEIADPMTHKRVEISSDLRFPVVVMTGDAPRIHLIDDMRRLPELSPGSSYLIPAGKDKAVERSLNEKLPRHADGGWVLRVERVAPHRQHIELFWMNDGYSGGGYEATPSSFLPRYRMSTGPGFAFIFGGIAIAINLGLWSIVGLSIWWWWRMGREP